MVTPTGHEERFDENEIIVSKTDPNGRITYVNDVFIRVSGYPESKLIGAPHSIIRHPDMPRGIFQLLWDTLRQRREIFAYVMNLCANGDHYWVLAHVTPTAGRTGEIIGYHSNRRVAAPGALDRIRPLYARLLAEEKRHERKPEGAAASLRLLEELMVQQGKSYDEFVWSLESQTAGAQ